MKKLNKQTIVISAASLILSGWTIAEVLDSPAGAPPGSEGRTPTMDTDSMSVPEPYLPETHESPFTWNDLRYNDANGTERPFLITMNDRGEKMSIRSAQQTLNELGYNIVVDGIAGPETQDALRDFQAANGIAQSAMLDEPTVSALRDSTSMNTDRFPASFEDESLPYDSAFPPFPEYGPVPDSGSAPKPR